MKNTIFLMVLACLLAGCAGKGPTAMKIKTEAELTSEQGLPVKVKAQDEKPLPIKIVPDEIAVGAVVAFLIAVVVTSLAAIAAWRAAYNTRKVLEKIKKRSDE
jgi:ABC-type lipoprotein release transport system permease subunit